MPRKPRSKIPGYYHILNRGVERRVVFKDNDHYGYFIDLLCHHSKNYNITIHNYCLMSNHYHLLIEIAQDEIPQVRGQNLSKFMRQLNSDYAVYFNRKYKRSRYLWQGRFKSWYMTDEANLYTLIFYIEQYTLKANMVKTVDKVSL